jgi:glycerol-3-phosphate dehydrogenase
LDAEGSALAAEVVFAMREEFALELTDIVFRRMMVGFNADQGRTLYTDIAAIAAVEAGWSPDHEMQQLDALTEYAESLRVG